ncbi:hypothetical protein BHE90_000114 [Fusarium euwallaceae]|uniref:Uncharacterized protein n=1 Tax=Fusarium euwallaceae TaxID=1147111 RepID=A0A430MBH0_9HYPO|nr:hypothetical protein BHE90_000114 [Fusarium euwallaceae]
MTIDCQFLFEKSQWGVLGRDQWAAGIIYMDLNFGPPQGCRVKSATVTVTLNESDECLSLYKTRSHCGEDISLCPVQITDFYGPKRLLGPEKTIEFKQTMSAAPEIHIMGGGASGLGFTTEKAFKSSSRWSFNGQLLSDEGHWTYRTLRWDLTYDEHENQSFQNDCVHTAFSFHHGGQPFLMKVEIEGRLGWNHRVKSKLKFGSKTKRKESQVTTLINFQDPETFKKRLDELATSLPMAMALENRRNVPIEIPDAAPVSSEPTSPETEDLAPYDMEPLQGSLSTREPLDIATKVPALEANRAPQGLQNQESQAQQDLTKPTEQNMARMLRRMTCPIEQDIIGKPLESSFTSVPSTVVAPEEEQPQMTSPPDEEKAELALANLNADQEAMLKILQIPALLTFLQLIATLMDMLGRSRKAKTITS